jgi:hypothetical protein
MGLSVHHPEVRSIEGLRFKGAHRPETQMQSTGNSRRVRKVRKRLKDGDSRRKRNSSPISKSRYEGKQFSFLKRKNVLPTNNLTDTIQDHSASEVQYPVNPSMDSQSNGELGFILILRLTRLSGISGEDDNTHQRKTSSIHHFFNFKLVHTVL